MNRVSNRLYIIKSAFSESLAVEKLKKDKGSGAAVGFTWGLLGRVRAEAAPVSVRRRGAVARRMRPTPEIENSLAAY